MRPDNKEGTCPPMGLETLNFRSVVTDAGSAGG